MCRNHCFDKKYFKIFFMLKPLILLGFRKGKKNNFKKDLDTKDPLLSLHPEFENNDSNSTKVL